MNLRYFKFVLSVFFAAILLFFSFNCLDTSPPLWWDEGWTLNVTKNWVQNGSYGQYLDGQLQPPGLSAAFPVVAPVALSFRAFGIDIWQGRLPGVIFMLVAMLVICLLACRLYNQRVAWHTLVLLVLMPASEKLHPSLIGQQLLGEVQTLLLSACGLLEITDGAG